MRMAVALVAAAPLAFTADNFPECTPAPACYPNRRAPHHGSLLNGACVPHPRPLPHATATAPSQWRARRSARRSALTHSRPRPHATETARCSTVRAPRSAALFNKWCSDKGTYWLSKHNYGAAYDHNPDPDPKP